MQEITTSTDIKSKIYTLRDKQVMLDRDLAELYGVETKVFNQAVKRNLQRFPEHFRFQLRDDEKNELVTNCDHLKNLKYSYVNPYAFTEQGVSMLSAVLRSDIAIKISIKIIDTFIQMRKVVSNNITLYERLSNVEQKQINLDVKQKQADDKIDTILKALEDKTHIQKQGIFYNGQIFDAHSFVSKLIRSAKESITLIDNYIDESTLTLLSKNQKANITIYTHTISNTLKQDIQKYNKQYKPLHVNTTKDFHDRFLILDDKEIYHIGASLKDLGKKVFGFSRMEDINGDIIKALI